MISRFILVGCLCFGSAVGQRNCRDQQYVPAPNNGLEITHNQGVTQTFTVGLSGQLTQVQLIGFSQTRGIALHPLEVAIVTTANGIPTTTTLVNLSVPPAAIPRLRSTVTLYLGFARLALTRGQVLGLRLRTLAPGGGPAYAWEADAITSTYAGGSVFVQDTTPLPWDMGFSTFAAVDASWSNYGSGHPGTLGVPALVASALPLLGTTIGIGVGNSGATATLGSLMVGFERTNLLTAFGGALLVVPTTSFAISIATGGAQVPFYVPGDPALCGAQVFLQSLQLDSGASQQMSFSPGLELDLG